MSKNDFQSIKKQLEAGASSAKKQPSFEGKSEGYKKIASSLIVGAHTPSTDYRILPPSNQTDRDFWKSYWDPTYETREATAGAQAAYDTARTDLSQSWWDLLGNAADTGYRASAGLPVQQVTSAPQYDFAGKRETALSTYADLKQAKEDQAATERYIAIMRAADENGGDIYKALEAAEQQEKAAKENASFGKAVSEGLLINDPEMIGKRTTWGQYFQRRRDAREASDYAQSLRDYVNSQEDVKVVEAWSKGNGGGEDSYRAALATYNKADEALKAVMPSGVFSHILDTVGTIVAPIGNKTGRALAPEKEYSPEIQQLIRNREQAAAVLQYAEEHRYDDLSRAEDYDLKADEGEQLFTEYKNQQRHDLLDLPDNLILRSMKLEELGKMNPYDKRISTDYQEPDDRWTEEEKRNYYYLFATDRNRANEYGIRIDQKYNSGEAEDRDLATEEFFTRNFATGAIGSVASIPANLIGGNVDYYKMAMETAARGSAYESRYQGASRWAETGRGAIASKFNEAGTIPDNVPVLGGKGWGDMYQLMMSMAESEVAVAAGGGVANAMFFGSSAASAARDALDRGIPANRAIAIGFAYGAAEVLGETLSIENLLSKGDIADMLRNGLLKEILQQGGVEASEEALTTIITTLSDAIINGDESEFQQNVYVNLSNGMSYEEAVRKARMDWLSDLGADALGGFLSGGIMGGIHIGAKMAPAAMTTYKGNAQSLVDSGRAVGEGSRSSRLADAYQRRVDRSGSISNLQAMRLQDSIANEVNKADRATIQKAVEHRLQDQSAEGMKESEARRLASDIVKAALDGDTSIKFDSELAESVYKDVVDQLSGNIKANSWLPVQDLLRTSVREAGAKSLKTVKEKGSSQQLDVKSAKMVDGKLQLTVDQNGKSKTLSVDQMDLNSYQKSALETLSRVLGNDAAAAFNGMTTQNMESDELGVLRYAAAFASVRDNLGRNNVNEEAALKSPLRNGLTDAQVIQALKIGQKLGPVKEGQRSKTRRGTGKVSLDGGILDKQQLQGVKDKDAVVNSNRYKTIQATAESLGVDIVLYQSRAVDDKGNLEKAPHGAYKDGVIWLDWNAGLYNENALKSETEYMVFLTMSHELTHFLEDNAENEYKELRDFITQYLAESDEVDFNDLVKTKLAEQEDLDYDGAVREVIADACQTMLSRSKYVEKLANEKPGLFQRIWSFIKEFFFGVAQNSPDAVEAKAIQDVADKVSELWDHALQVAVESRMSAEAIDAMPTTVEVAQAMPEIVAETLTEQQQQQIAEAQEQQVVEESPAAVEEVTAEEETVAEVESQEEETTTDESEPVTDIERTFSGDSVQEEAPASEQQAASSKPFQLFDVDAGPTEAEKARWRSEREQREAEQKAKQRADAERKRSEEEQKREARRPKPEKVDKREADRVYDSLSKKIGWNEQTEISKEDIAFYLSTISDLKTREVRDALEEDYRIWNKGALGGYSYDSISKIANMLVSGSSVSFYGNDILTLKRAIEGRKIAQQQHQQTTETTQQAAQQPAQTEKKLTASEKAAIKRRFNAAVEDLITAYLFDGVDLSREDAERMITEYAALHDGYFSMTDEAKQKGELKTKKQYARDFYETLEADEAEAFENLEAESQELVARMGDGTTIEANEDGEMEIAVSEDRNTIAFSPRTYQDSGKAKLVAALKENGHTQEEIDAVTEMIEATGDFLEKLADQFAESHGYMNLKNNLLATVSTNVKTGKQVISTLVNNGDYPVNLDLQLICKKRVAYMHMLTRLIDDGVFERVDFKGSAIADLNKVLRDGGFETACLGCFVEARRLQLQAWAETIVEEWNAAVDKRNPQAGFFNFAQGGNALNDMEIAGLITELENGGKKNDKGNLNLGVGAVADKMGRLLDRIPSLQQHLTVADLLTPQGMSTLREYDQNLFSLVKQRYGANSPKIVQDFNAYNSEIADLSFKFVKDMIGETVKGSGKYTRQAKKALKREAGESKEAYNRRVETEAMRRYLYDIGGARIQSFSDFMIENVFDYMQIIADLSAREFPLHGYSKEAVFLRLFGMTGGKFNGSLIAHVDGSMGKEYAGLLPASEASNGRGIVVDVDGKKYAICFDDYARHVATGSFIQSIGMKDIVALQLDPRYSKNVGSITIGVSDKQILAMLDSPYFRMVIPYHSSGILPEFARLVGVNYYNDYQDYQTTKVAKCFDLDGNPVDGFWQANGKAIGIDTHFDFNEAVQRLGDAKAAADEYLEWCKQRHPVYDGKKLVGYATFMPKFSDSPYGTDFTTHPNYYKLLEDFNVYDSIGEASALQGAVTMTFPSEATRLTAEQMAAYKQALRDTGLYTEKEINKYAAKADMTFQEIISEEIGNRAEYESKQAKVWDATVNKAETMLLEKYGREAGKTQLSARTQKLSDVEKRAVKQFGTTKDFAEAGYILADGRMLRFSDDRHAGAREYDHRAIGRVYGVNIDLNKNHGFDESSGKYLEQFVDAGNIRIEAGDPDLDMDAGIQLSENVPLTPAQEQTIRNFIEWKKQRDSSFKGDEYSLYDGPLALHIDFGGNADLAVFASAHDMNTWGVKNLSYEGGQINADRVIQDIRHYYQTGETRRPSVVAQFHSQYSARTGEKSDRDLLLDASEAGMTDAEKRAAADYKAKVDVFRQRQQAATAALDALDKAVQAGNANEANKLRTKLTAAEKKMSEALAALTEAERGPELREILRREREIQRQRTTKRIRDSYTRRELRRRVDRLWKDLNKRITSPTEKKRIPVELMQQAIDVLQAINMDTTKEGSQGGQKLRNKLLELRARYTELQNDPDFRRAAVYDAQVAEYLDNMIEVVGDTPINRMSNEQLAAVFNVLQALDHTARNAVKIKLRDQEIEAYEVSKHMTAETRSAGKKMTGAIQTWINAQLSPERMFNRLGGYTKNSYWSRVYEMLDEGQLKQTQLMMEGSLIFEDLLSGKDYEKFVDPKNTVDVGLKDENGNNIVITHGMMVALYMHLQNEQNRRHVAYGGLTIPALKDYYSGKKVKGSENAVRVGGVLQEMADLNDRIREEEDASVLADLEAQRDMLSVQAADMIGNLQAAIETKLTDYDRQWIAASRELFDGFSKRVLNQTTLEIYGIKRANVENYMPIWVDGDFLNTPFESVAKDMSLENAGFMKERVDSSKPIRLADISDVTASQIRKVSQYCGLMPVIRAFNKVWGKTQTGYRDSLQKAVHDTFGQSGVKYIENLMADLNGARGTEDSALGEFLNRMRGHMAQASLTLSLRTALGQTASYPTAAAVLGWDALSRGITDYKKVDPKLIQKWSPLLYYRMKGYRDPELGNIAEMNSKWDRLWKKARWATGWIQAFDGFTVGQLVWSASEAYVQIHNKNLVKGTDAYYEAVAKKFNAAVELTQPNYTTMQRPDILRNPNALVKQLTMFLTQRLQNFNIVFDAAATYSKYRSDFREKKNGVTAEDVRQAGVATRDAVLSQVAAAATITAFKFLADVLLHAMNNYRDDDKELTKESISLELLDMFIDSLAGNVLGGGELYDIIESKVFGKTYYGIEVSGISTVTDLIDAAGKVYDHVASGDFSMSDLNLLAKRLGPVAGIPYANAMKIINGGRYWVEDAINGELFSFEAGVDRTTAQQAHRLYRAYVAMDYGQVDKIRAEVPEDKQDDLDTAVRSYIKDQYKAGEMTVYEAARQLKKYGGASDQIMSNFIRDQFTEGNLKEKDASKLLTQYAGKTEEAATKSVRGWSAKQETGLNYDDIDDQFQLGELSAKDAKAALVKYGVDSAKADMKVGWWSYQKDNPGTSLTEAKFETYWKEYKAIGLTPKMYEDFKAKWDAVPGTDKNGDGKADSGSKKAGRLAVIDKLPLTSAQKDQLYLLNWSESGLKDAPWHK